MGAEMTATERREAATEMAAALKEAVQPQQVRLGVYRVAWQMAELLTMAAAAETQEESDAAQQALAQYITWMEVEKVDDIARVIHHVQSLVGTSSSRGLIDQEIDRLRTLKARHEAFLSGLKQTVMQVMETAGVKKLVSPHNQIRIQNSPPSVVIDDPPALPDAYRTVTIHVDRELWDCIRGESGLARGLGIPAQDIAVRRVADSLKAGVDVPGAHLHQGAHLRVA